jgi:hypothetical protein
MRRDDILINELYSRINNPNQNLTQLEENIFQSARKWFDRMSNVPEQNIDDVAYSALKKAAQEVERAGFDSSKIMSLDFITKFKDTIKKTSGSEEPKEDESTTSGDTGVTSQEQPTGTPSFNPQPESKDDLKFAPKPSTPQSSVAKKQPYQFDRYKGLANAEGLKKLNAQLGSEEIPTEAEPPFKKEKVSILDFKSEMGLSEDEFSYLKRNGLFGNDIKNGMIPKKYMDDENIWYYLDQRRTAPKKSTATAKPAAVKKPAVSKKPAAVKKPTKKP